MLVSYVVLAGVYTIHTVLPGFEVVGMKDLLALINSYWSYLLGRQYISFKKINSRDPLCNVNQYISSCTRHFYLH